MLASRGSYDRGDTVIEVMLAIVVFSSIAVGVIALMNRGAAIAQVSLETTHMRHQIDAQVEMLRYIQNEYARASVNTEDTLVTGVAASWVAMKADDNVVAAAMPYREGASDCPDVPERAFIINTTQGTLHTGTEGPQRIQDSTSPYARVNYDIDNNITSADGIWIEAVRANTDQNYIDFHIRTCSYGPGSSQPIRSGTIVRLYDPASLNHASVVGG